MEKKAVRVIIEGIVQGVFFRAYTQKAAFEYGVNGWVRNLPDGRVEAFFEGEKDRVDKMIAWCYKGSPSSRVENVTVEEVPYEGKYSDFKIVF